MILLLRDELEKAKTLVCVTNAGTSAAPVASDERHILHGILCISYLKGLRDFFIGLSLHVEQRTCCGKARMIGSLFACSGKRSGLLLASLDG